MQQSQTSSLLNKHKLCKRSNPYISNSKCHRKKKSPSDDKKSQSLISFWKLAPFCCRIIQNKSTFKHGKAKNNKSKFSNKHSAGSEKNQDNREEEMFKEYVKKDARREHRRQKRIDQRQNEKVCYNCRQPGHNMSECPATVLDNQQGTGICFKCGSTEHSSNNCHAKFKQENIHMLNASYVERWDIFLNNVQIIHVECILRVDVVVCVVQLNISRKIAQNSKSY